MGKLQDKTDLITGASSGIGRGCAVRFAQEGAHIATIRQKMTVTTMVAENNIPICKVSEDTDSVRLLPQVGMRGAEKHTFREFFEYSFLETADAIELAIEDFVICGHDGENYTSRDAFEPYEIAR